MIIKHFLMILTVIIAPGICTADEYDPKPDRREPRPVYPIYSWPQDLVSVPCSAWKKDNHRSLGVDRDAKLGRRRLAPLEPDFSTDHPGRRSRRTEVRSNKVGEEP
jgi:hypothetical protein